MRLILGVALLVASIGDADGDGLSDFQEVHKYFTDPARADSDGDGVPDSDWVERREFTYSVRAILHVLPPIEVASLCDDYQDGRVLEARDDAVEIEVVCYPFNTNTEALDETGGEAVRVADLARWIEPGPTTNWDAELQRRMRADMKEAGLVIEGLSERKLVERVSEWLFQRSGAEDGFTTFAADFVDGRPRVPAALQASVERELARTGRSLTKQWDRELFGKSMYVNGVHGTCTSSAIYLSTCLRALGVPTRTIVCIPVIDASDAREVAVASLRLTHPRVRSVVLRAARAAGNSWCAHTFNEAYVGGRWRRLNYTVLGQNILDSDYLGLMVHVNTFREFAESGLVAWGLRTVRDPTKDVFGGSNPYSCASLSDEFGPHSKIPVPVPSITVFRITKAYWLDDRDKPRVVDMKNVADGGHLLVRIAAVEGADDFQSCSDAYAAIGKELVLKSPGRPDVRASAERGFWFDARASVRDFYVHIAPGEFAHMERGVRYTIAPVDTESATRWAVDDGVSVTRR